jgi:hypothetical protein
MGLVYGRRVGMGLNWHRIGSSGGLYEHGNKSPGSIRQEISWLYETLLAFSERLCCLG